MPEAAVKLIKKAKPYQGPDNPLGRLHELDIADKHKLLVPVGILHNRTVKSFTLDQFFAANPGATEVTMEEVVTLPAGIVTPDIPFPVKDGAEIYRIPARLRSDPVAQMHMYPKFEFEIAFGEVEVDEGEPVIPTLHQLIEFVERFVKLFPPLFSQESS